MRKLKFGSLIMILALFAILAPSVSATIVSFDYGSGNSTYAFSISNNGNIVGYYVDSGGVTRGYERFANGTFSAPIVDPNDNGNYTGAFGINNAGTIAGEYLTVSGGVQTYHGFTLVSGSYTTLDVPGPYSTGLFGINDNGDISGTFGSNVQPNAGFLYKNGTFTIFSDPNATGETFADGINNLDQIVGRYNAGGVNHGFLRNPNGTFQTIDYPGAASSTALGINDDGDIVGAYHDAQNHIHGFIDVGGIYTPFDVPGAMTTVIAGIDNAGDITGYWTDANGVNHGFVDVGGAVPEPFSIVVWCCWARHGPEWPWFDAAGMSRHPAPLGLPKPDPPF